MKENEQKIKEKIVDLRKKIIYHDSLYFEKNISEISDYEYDKLFKLLQKLEHNYYYLFSQEENDNSPTQRVAPLNISVFKKEKHSQSMLSLNKAYSFEELEKFSNDAQAMKQDGNIEFYIEPKIDGMSIAIYYENGNLIKALTRGNGIEGEDITENVLKMSSNFINKKINYMLPLEIRGEIFLSKTDFEKLKSKSNNILANPRNATAGILRRKKDLNNEISYLSAFFYQVINPFSHNLLTHDKTIDFLKENNFSVNDLGLKTKSISKAYKHIEKIMNLKNTLDYEIDGCVVKINDFDLFNKLGVTSKFPKGAIAFKFYDEIVNTKLIGIDYQIGRTGKLAYIAKLEPVILNGTKVSKAYLHNYQNIINLKINLNEEVQIKKAGEIIPQVIGTTKKFSESNIEILVNCPFCGQKIHTTDKEQFCLNENCIPIILNKILHFFSKEAINVETLSKKTVESLYKNKIIFSAYDIFNLKNKLKELSEIGFRQKSAQKLLKAIEVSKKTTIAKFIYGLGIKNVGLRNAKLLANEINTIDEFINYDYNKLLNIKNLGPIIVEQIQLYLKNENNISFLNKLKNIDFIFEQKQQNNNLIFKDKVFVITGTLTKPRNYFKKIIEENGGKISSSISANTNYLLLGENPGSKYTKAKELKINILTEEDFLKLL
ncbi:NAD(+)-dependent DNA ligase [Mesomycoplasma neurolyticum]|uniref:DNA ligase n=2 Tax=Mesomycoplasma neurolyticum TaxID=2120 RepID=A0A449A4J2_9BACT|nr:NAD(+)-dependent DNA ligase [Mesomycoplasma neurolyticum]